MLTWKQVQQDSDYYNVTCWPDWNNTCICDQGVKTLPVLEQDANPPWAEALKSQLKKSALLALSMVGNLTRSF